MQYQHPQGFYTGVNVQSASRTAVDYANTFYAPAYTIFGANVGYETPKKDWKVSLDLKNLVNKKYVTAVQPLYDAKGQDTAALYPGDGVGAYVGVESRYWGSTSPSDDRAAMALFVIHRGGQGLLFEG